MTEGDHDRHAEKDCQHANVTKIRFVDFYYPAGVVHALRSEIWKVRCDDCKEEFETTM